MDEDATPWPARGLSDNMNVDLLLEPISEKGVSTCSLTTSQWYVPPKMLIAHSLNRFSMTSSQSFPQKGANSRPKSVFP